MVYTAPQTQVSDRLSWTLLVPHREDVRLDSIGVYQDYIALEERREGLTEIRILTSQGQEQGKIHFPEPMSIPRSIVPPPSTSTTSRQVRVAY